MDDVATLSNRLYELYSLQRQGAQVERVIEDVETALKKAVEARQAAREERQKAIQEAQLRNRAKS